MFIVTNREIRAQKGDVNVLGTSPNVKGPNELCLLEATKRAGKWTLEVLPDEVPLARLRDIGKGAGDDPHVAGYVAERLLRIVNPKAAQPNTRRKGKNLLVFVHGFNNDVLDVLERSLIMARKYDVEVLPFTWPANGGGVVTGTLSYKSDKRDAKASVGALDRVFEEVGRRLEQVNAARVSRIQELAKAKHPDNFEEQNRLISRLLDQECPFTVNLLLHSMGNYLYKHLLLSSASEGTGLVFDNVVLAAADTNNEEHELWVDRIRCRRRVYVTINEDDTALGASRLKSGGEQLARLGHYPFNLVSNHAAYVQFTGAAHVGRSHAYFADDATKNPRVSSFFKQVLNGERADKVLHYDAGSNTYLIDGKKK